MYDELSVASALNKIFAGIPNVFFKTIPSAWIEGQLDSYNFPYVVYDIGPETPVGFFDSDNIRFRLRVVIYNKWEADTKVILDLRNQINKLLHRTYLTIDGLQNTQCRRIQGSGLVGPDESDRRLAKYRLEFLLEASELLT